jgi:CubicO group peptidase (beta-lactamase class C family)
MLAIDEKRVRWDVPIGDILGKTTGDTPVRRATLLQLLNHSSGLPAWRQFYLEGFPLEPTESQAHQTRATILEAILDTPLNAPSGTRHEYSDLGYILLADLLERIFDAPLGELARERIFAPLGMEHTRYVYGSSSPPIEDAVATEVCPLRGRVIQGTVHDENTHIIGGVSAHAGVFSTALDLHRFTSHLLAISTGRLPRGLIRRDTLRFAWSPAAACPGGSHRGGWDTPSGPQSSAGRGFSRDATVGHLGFSGTSFWIDRATSLTAILLTNRIHPSRNNPRIKDLRVAFHEAILPPTTTD